MKGKLEWFSFLTIGKYGGRGILGPAIKPYALFLIFKRIGLTG